MIANKVLSESNVILCGLAFTSRTETLEDYLRRRVKSLTVIALSSCFLKENLSECRIYRGGELENKFSIANFRIRGYRGLWQPLILLVFAVNWAALFLMVLKLRKKFSFCISVSHSFALIGTLFKKTGISRKLIYYCIDYYIPEDKVNFNSLFVKAINVVDRLAVNSADMIWDISPNIAGYRHKFGRIPQGSYRHTVVPLGYARSLARFRPVEEINRWAIGFIGTITASQGLELLVEAMPGILRQFPLIKARIIGEGHYLEELKSLVLQKGLGAYFTFYGFIKDEQEMLDILSRCAIGVALWSSSSDTQNITCADPGKTKLYALCGLPIITTTCCRLSGEIDTQGIGIAIDYDKEALSAAVIKLLSQEQLLREYKARVAAYAENFFSEGIFEKALSDLKSL